MEKEAIRFYIKTRTLLGVSASAIHEELTTAHGDRVVSYSTVQKWAKLFRDGRMEIEDDPRSGRPVSKITDESIEAIRRVIEDDPHATYDDLKAETMLSRGTLYRIVTEHLKVRKVTSRWVPHDLTEEQKQQRVKICKENLKKFRRNSWRLCDIVTGDETWIYFRQIGRKASNSTWASEGQSPGTVVRRKLFEPKLLFSIFFRSNGALLVHCLDVGEKMDRLHYIEYCLKPVVKELWKDRPISGTHGIKLLHDNAPSHDAKDVENFLAGEGINLMPHPPYSPDLSPCDYWLNDYIKRNLPDQTNESSLFQAVSKIVFSIPEKEYKKTFDKLIERMELCIKHNGEYFEHLID